MRPLAHLLRLLLTLTFAVGLGLPASAQYAAAAPAPAPSPSALQQVLHSHVMHHAVALKQAQHPATADETCRQHCLGVTVLTATVLPGPVPGGAKPVYVVALDSARPSRLPMPEGHPPRA